MIYKKHELSISLNGDRYMHIARNASGNVVFRENSEKELKKEIDDYIKEQDYLNQLEEQKKLEKENKKKAKVEEIVTEEPVTEPVAIATTEEVLVPQKRVTRGPDGKFISKSQLDTDEDLKRKSFWDKLTS